MIEGFNTAQDIAAHVARSVHRKYHTYFDVADVRQELIVWMLSHENKVAEYMADEELGIKKLSKTLRRQADKYCRRKKAQIVGYSLEDEAYYPGSIIATLLPYVWKDVEAMHIGDGEKISNSGNPAEGGNFVIQIFDIRKALDELDPQDRLILQMKYFEGQTFAEIGEILEISDTTAHRKHEGALRRLSNYLGGMSPFSREEIEQE